MFVVTLVLCVVTLICLLLALFTLLARNKALRRGYISNTTFAGSTDNKLLSPLPGPKSLPIIGNLHVIGKYSNPFVAFTALSKVYGDIYRLTLGSSPCIVVNTFPLIKEVLITKGSQFGGRPDFIRFHKLFGGDRNNCKYD